MGRRERGRKCLFEREMELEGLRQEAEDQFAQRMGKRVGVACLLKGLDSPLQ